MTAERLSAVIDHCFRVRRLGNRAAHYRDIASFLGVHRSTLLRWLNGKQPIPRPVEVIFEIFAHWPEVTAEGVQAAIERDEAIER
jgi:hypothetical protein